MFINGNNLSMMKPSNKGITVSTVYERSDSGLILPLGAKPKEEKKEDTKEEKK